MRLSLPTKKQVLKGILWFLLTLFVGALANGVWQSLLGPAIHFSTRWILDLASLGLTGYKNGVYRQVAADNQSAVGVETLTWLFIVSGLMLGWFFGDSWSSHQENRSKCQDLLKKLSDAPTASDPPVTMDSIKLELAAILKTVNRARWFLYFSSLVIGVIFISHQVSMARLSYVNSASAHYHQVLRVASPYLDAHEQAEVESDFAQVASRDDYVRLLSRLEGQCKAHGKTAPKFDPW